MVPDAKRSYKCDRKRTILKIENYILQAMKQMGSL